MGLDEKTGEGNKAKGGHRQHCIQQAYLAGLSFEGLLVSQVGSSVRKLSPSFQMDSLLTGFIMY